MPLESIPLHIVLACIFAIARPRAAKSSKIAVTSLSVTGARQLARATSCSRYRVGHFSGGAGGGSPFCLALSLALTVGERRGGAFQFGVLEEKCDSFLELTLLIIARLRRDGSECSIGATKVGIPGLETLQTPQIEYQSQQNNMPLLDERIITRIM